MTDSSTATKTTPRSYSTAHVATRLGVSVPTVQRWVDAGQLKAWKTLGGHRRIDAESAERLFASQSAPPEAPAARAWSVVVVDDNPDDREILAALCAEALPGARITVAENGFQGLVAIGQTAPDMVITDIVMPKMDGIEMLTQLAGHCDVQPPVLVATSSQPAEHVHKRLPPGVRFVPKPLEPDEVVALLHAAVAALKG